MLPIRTEEDRNALYPSCQQWAEFVIYRLMASFVLVAGAWLGGWCWGRVADVLLDAGHRVLAPTLTGLGGRAELISRDVGLLTHVMDLDTLFRSEDLRRVILVGHSYGGTVITAAAEFLVERLDVLVFLDASIPEDGQSNNDVLPPTQSASIRQRALRDGDGWLVPPPSVMDWGLESDDVDWVERRLAPHPLKALEDPVRVSPAISRVPRAYIRSSRDSALYERLYARAAKEGWYCQEINGGHYPMLTAPHAVATALLEVERACRHRPDPL